MIEIRVDDAGELYRVRASGATVHLKVLENNAIMLIIEDSQRHVHLRISKPGRGHLRVWEHEAFDLPDKREQPIL